jgi:hypothetical protein
MIYLGSTTGMYGLHGIVNTDYTLHEKWLRVSLIKM